MKSSTTGDATIAKVHALSDGGGSIQNKTMKSAEHGDSEKGELRVKLEGAIDKAKDLCDRLQDQTASAAKATDRTIREHPYHAIGIAFGVGVLIGVLVSRGRD